MAVTALRKHPVTRMAHYAFLLPFLPGLRPLMVNFHVADLVIYCVGMVLIILLIIYGNLRPFILIEKQHIALYLHYRHQEEIHPYKEISSFSQVSKTRIRINSKGHHPVSIHLGKKDLKRFKAALEDNGILAE